MESNCERKTKAIDASVGGLVWVRRRNGSWWPGRIMGLDELPESCLVSPRSGTPVKLLGREDASVDWYNLEKSKRVKAFRCGEYDECIEKAKASAANLGKKVVKYARREDAILHALELESACKGNTHQEFYFQKDESAGVEHDNWVGKSQKMFDLGNENEFVAGNVSAIEGSSTQELSQSGLSFEDPNRVGSPKLHSMQKKKRKTPNDSEDDETEKTKRMRGLEDLGMGVVSKGNSNICHTDPSPEQVHLDGASLSESNIVNSFSNGSPVNSSRDYCPSLRKRRSQVANVYESLKKKNRRRPLIKVLESTAMVAVPVVCDQGASPGGSSLQELTDSKVSALESTESKKTSVSAVFNNNSDSTVVSCEKETSVNASDHTCDAGVDAFPFHCEMRDNEFSSASEFPDNNCSDSLFDVPFVREEKHTGGFSPLIACSSRKLQSGTEGLDESGSTCVAAHANNVCQRIEKGTSKWKLKGKRNSRNLSKKMNKHLDSRRPRDADDRPDGYLVGIQHMDECSQLAKSRLVPEGLGDRSHHNHLSYEISHREMQIGQSSSYLDSSKYRRHKLGGKDVSILTIDGEKGQYLSHEKSLVGKSMTHMRSKEPLLTRRMPVSPLTTQRLLPQFHSHFTPYSRYQIADAPIRNVSGGSSLYDVKLDVRASYRGQHVPLVSLMSKLNGKAIVGHPITVEVLDEGYCDLLVGNIDCCPESSSCELYDAQRENILDRSTDVPNKSLLLDGDEGTGGALQVLTSNAVQSHVEYPRNPVKHLTGQHSLSPKKYPKARKGGILSKKTRRLSSFAVTQPGEDNRKPVVEKLGGPVIACVPLKVVFSRINEAVNSSSRSAHRGPTSDNP
ncbi:uncharacterized protein At1g51745-like isoform X2 [Telopea speciosissima]|uniref:uncharacterized protein At1g51745-like isoform X2 n=1 Tax=Telopea speciosissima TaxID=54955 RepID=UPI001CC44C01|nr:uncharacterized protein At1g51745-like isoform X2 [Telopea speciosissima]